MVELYAMMIINGEMTLEDIKSAKRREAVRQWLIDHGYMDE